MKVQIESIDQKEQDVREQLTLAWQMDSTLLEQRMLHEQEEVRNNIQDVREQLTLAWQTDSTLREQRMLHELEKMRETIAEFETKPDRPA